MELVCQKKMELVNSTHLKCNIFYFYLHYFDIFSLFLSYLLSVLKILVNMTLLTISDTQNNFW
jgi:hypothetical protein